MKEEIYFTRGCGGRVSFAKMLEEIIDFINEKKSYYRIMIGTDSEIENENVDFVSAVVIHRVGFGARFFYRRWKKENEGQNNKFYLIHQRIWEEVINSLELAQKLSEYLKNKKVPVNFEVHIDVGYNGQTKEIIQELINYIRTYGLEVKVKPESFAASKVADRYVNF